MVLAAGMLSIGLIGCDDDSCYSINDCDFGSGPTDGYSCDGTNQCFSSKSQCETSSACN